MIETTEPFRDRRPAVAWRREPRGGLRLFEFDVGVRTADGQLHQIPLCERSRYSAIDLAERIAAHEDVDRPTDRAIGVSVALKLDSPRMIRNAPDESRGVAEHHVELLAGGVRSVVRVDAASRRRAIREALLQSPRRATVEAVIVRWSVVGYCLACTTPVFADCRHRVDRRGVRCGDC